MQEEQNQPTQDAPAHQPGVNPADPLNLMGDAPAKAEAASERVPHRKVRTGLVVSNKMQKSIVVAIVRRVRHPLYKKYFNLTKKLMAHDETNDAKVGDTVRIVETRPLSARKRWRLDTIIDRAK